MDFELFRMADRDSTGSDPDSDAGEASSKRLNFTTRQSQAKSGDQTCLPIKRYRRSLVSRFTTSGSSSAFSDLELVGADGGRRSKPVIRRQTNTLSSPQQDTSTPPPTLNTPLLSNLYSIRHSSQRPTSPSSISRPHLSSSAPVLSVQPAFCYIHH